MKTITEKDLAIGDVLIFENQDFNLSTFWKKLQEDYKEQEPQKRKHAAFYLLLYLIAWFDPGDEGAHYKNIYHAAFWGKVDENRGKGKPKERLGIVQAGRGGIEVADLQETLTKKENAVKNIYVYRKIERPSHFTKNIHQQAQLFYNDRHIHYAYETAGLLAIICSMRYSEGEIYKQLEKHLGPIEASAVITMIQLLINDYNDQHQKEMVVCTTLVTMIYKNAGFPLRTNAFHAQPNMVLPQSFRLLPELIHAPNRIEKKLLVAEFKATMITPRQLAESPDLEIIGVLHHS